jgi:hypothetical protein
MPLTKEWSDYNHDYEKELQDIKTRTGTVYLNCWPNAGEWNVCNDDHQKAIPDEWVTQTRLTHVDVWTV